MIEHCLYGVKVFCDFPLFDRPVPLSAVAPGKHPALELQRKPDEEALQEFTESIPFNDTHGRELFLRTDRELSRSAAGQPWCLEVQNVVMFTWSGGEPVIRYQLQEEGSQALLVFWFVHIFLPLHLTLERGYDFIHSAAVEVDGQPLLFIAPSTGGKSTLGDYFLKQGHPMLSDDKVATFFHEGEFWAVPSHPHHRPFREYEVLGYPVENFAAEARPIHAFYILEAGEPDSAIEIAEVEGFRKFEQLLPNYLYSFHFLQQQRMRWLAQLADQSLVFKVSRPWDLDRMREVYDTICDHSRSLPG
jgi:hypothetical protein